MDRYYPDTAYTVQFSYPVLRGTAEMYCDLAKWDSTRRFYFFPPFLSVSENIMEKSVLDAVLAARWNLKTSIDYANRLGRDAALAKRWKNVYDNLYIPQNDTIYLEYLNDTQQRGGGGYFGIRAFMYLGFPLLEQIKDIDIQKARRALDYAWQRNRNGEGMIGFISNWFALTEAYLGFGDRAYAMSSLFSKLRDSTDILIFESISRRENGSVEATNPYHLPGYSSYILVPIPMLVHSCDNRIEVFPAVPTVWKDVEFYDLPVERGIRVSALMKDGRTQWVCYSKDGMPLLESSESAPVQILTEKNRTVLRIQK
jgi:hypothetical protein